MNLTNKEIIDLYDQKEFDTIIANIKLDPKWKDMINVTIHLSYKTEYSQLCSQSDYNKIICNIVKHNPVHRILKYVIFTSNLEIFSYLFTINNLSYVIIINVLQNPLLYPILEHLLESDNNLCNNICNMIKKKCSRIISHDIASNNNISLLKIVLKYFPDSNIIHFIIASSICVNNLEILNILFSDSYDIQLAFDKLMNNIDYFGFDYFIMRDYNANISITIDTIIWLDQYDIKITNHLNKISMIFISSNDLIGIKYCLDSGYNATTILSFIHHQTDLSIVKYLLEYGANVNRVNVHRIYASVDLLALLIESGLDISKDALKLALSIIYYNHPKTLSYIIQLYPDIIHQEDCILLFLAYRVANINMVEILLNNGASSDEILSFTNYKFYDRIDKICPYFSKSSYNIQWTPIIKLLIKRGINVTDPQYTFSIIINSKLDAELLEIFINLGVDLNVKIYDTYIFEKVIKDCRTDIIILFIKYGADPFINSHRPLEIAIEKDLDDVVELLLGLGSTVDLDFLETIPISPDVALVLEKYGYII